MGEEGEEVGMKWEMMMMMINFISVSKSSTWPCRAY